MVLKIELTRILGEYVTSFFFFMAHRLNGLPPIRRVHTRLCVKNKHYAKNGLYKRDEVWVDVCNTVI